MWNIHSGIADLIKFSDTKAGAVLTANGVIVGFALSNASAIDNLLSTSTVFSVLLAVGMTSVYLSSILCLFSIMPRLNLGKSNSIVFFVSIANSYKTADDYGNAVEKLFTEGNEDALLANEIWTVARIAKRKYLLVGIGLWFFASTLLTTLVFLLLAIVSS